jgi:hypothetical protein
MSRIAWAWSVRQVEPLHEVRLRLLDVRRLADRLDDRVEVVEGDLQALEDVGPARAFSRSNSVRRRTISRRWST